MTLLGKTTNASRVCGNCCTTIDHLGVAFGRNVVLNDVSLHINCGELVAIVGPNGAGKTTLLKAILGEVPYTGSISFSIRGAASSDARIGYVPQRLNFDGDSPISVCDFMSSAISRHPVWLGVRPSLGRKCAAALERFSAQHLLRRRLGELSGGELQRVLLAMAMTPVPDLLLLDEPVSGIDAKGLSVFYETVCDLRREHDVSIIMVTHDLPAIAPHADRMVFIRQTVLAEGKPSDVLANTDLIVSLGSNLWTISRFSESVVKREDHHD